MLNSHEDRWKHSLTYNVRDEVEEEEEYGKYERHGKVQNNMINKEGDRAGDEG